MRRAHLQPDHEQEHHHTQLGHVQDGLRLGEPTEAERPDHQTGDEIAQHRTQPQSPEQRHGHHGRAEQRYHLHQFRRGFR
ncbi:hypothetical protein D3C81_633100 [compost metagenome]